MSNRCGGCAAKATSLASGVYDSSSVTFPFLPAHQSEMDVKQIAFQKRKVKREKAEGGRKEEEEGRRRKTEGARGLREVEVGGGWW